MTMQFFLVAFANQYQLTCISTKVEAEAIRMHRAYIQIIFNETDQVLLQIHVRP